VFGIQHEWFFDQQMPIMFQACTGDFVVSRVPYGYDYTVEGLSLEHLAVIGVCFGDMKFVGYLSQ
jgi:hypothetical protein